MRAYQDMVFSTIVRITNNDAHAEDLSQEVFLKAYEQFAQLRESPAAGGWLKTVARNLALNHLTRYRKRWRLFSELARDDDGANEEASFAVPDGSLEPLHANARHEAIERALQQLPEHRRLPLVLFHFEELSYQEIAAHLRISEAKVKVDILRARRSLARTLATSELNSEALTAS